MSNLIKIKNLVKLKTGLFVDINNTGQKKFNGIITNK